MSWAESPTTMPTTLNDVRIHVNAPCVYIARINSAPMTITVTCARLPTRTVTFACARLRANARIVTPRTPRAMRSATAATTSAQKVLVP